MTEQSPSPSPQGSASVYTGFSQLFGAAAITAIQIPLIQRNYAQGRKSAEVGQIRQRFIGDLCRTLSDASKTLDLDFVFGHVVDGTLYPLDGQQRLTTLFLLHCYLSWNADSVPGTATHWHAFTYATRPGAREFCGFLVHPEMRPQCGEDQSISAWLTDQAAYLPTWEHDPTIQGMLVVLDEIQSWYGKLPAGQGLAALKHAWRRLADADQSAIRFHLLPLTAHDSGDTLYVRMNSRGKPLTDFENFKAELEELLGKNMAIPAGKVAEFSRQMDTDWANLFWEYRGDNDLIDEEFMRYLRFLFEVQAWKAGIQVDQRKSDAAALEELSADLLGSGQTGAEDCLDWISRDLELWMLRNSQGVLGPKDIQREFERLFTRTETSATVPLRVFNFAKFDAALIGVDLFRACCDLYGTGSWTLAHTLLLHGVICAFHNGDEEESQHGRLRLLRDLIEASEDEIRADSTRNNMPELLVEVESIITGGALSNIRTFNQVQVANERAKAAFLQTHPGLRDELWRLEDHVLLRGGLTAFDLNPAQVPQQFKQRAIQFAQVFRPPFLDLTGAMLAKGDYSRRSSRWTGHELRDLGAPENRGPWQSLLRGKRDDNGKHPCAVPLMDLLKDLAANQDLAGVMNGYLASCVTNRAMDWRYYLVKYPAMRDGASGRYAFSKTGYQACMLDKERFTSDYRDPYLTALLIESGVTAKRAGKMYFTGYENQARELVLTQSGLRIECVDAGWRVSVGAAHQAAFELIAVDFGYQVSSNTPVEWLYKVKQCNGVDAEDRIDKGSTFLKALIAGGL